MAEAIAQDHREVAPSLRDRAMHGMVWSLAAYFGSQVVRLGSSMVMTRLLFPEAFGVYTLVMTYMTGIVMFSDMGLWSYLFQSKNAHDRDLADSIWTVGVVRGGIVWICGMGLAWPMAGFYERPEMRWMLIAASLALLVSPLCATKLILATRDLKRKELAIFTLSNQAVCVVIQLGLAWWFRSIWALVIGGLVGEVLRAASSQWLFPGPRNRWRWDSVVVRELRGFSTWIYISSIMGFFGGQADRLIMGKLVPMEFLGIYGIAMNFATLPLALIQQGSGMIAPIVVQLRHGADPAIGRKLQEARGLLLQVGAVLLAGTCVAAPAFYGLLYDSRYATAGTIAAVISVSIWFSMMENSVNGVVLAFGDAKGIAICSTGRMLGTLAGALGGYWIAGIYGFIVGLSMGSLVVYVLSIILIRKHGIHLGWGDARYCAVLAVLAGLGWGTIGLLRWGSPTIPMTRASLLASALVAVVGAAYQWGNIRKFGAMGLAKVSNRRPFSLETWRLVTCALRGH